MGVAGILKGVTTRRGWRGDAVYFDHTGPCTDVTRHRNCPGRWRGAISLGFGPDGKRIRRKVSGPSRAAVTDRLARLHAELDAGSKAAPPNYTLRTAAEDWLQSGLPGRSAKTIRKNKDVLEPILAAVGAARLRELSAADVDTALAHMSQTYSTAAVRMGHLALKRAIRHAQARRYVTVNVADLAGTRPASPAGPANPSPSSRQEPCSKPATGRASAPTSPCRSAPASGPRRPGRCAGTRSTSATRTPAHRGRPVSRSGDRYEPARTPRPQGPGEPSPCRTWPSPGCTGCKRQKEGLPARCSPPGTEASWTRPTSAASSAQR